MTGPIAWALDTLQRETNAYFGTLLPTIYVASQQLKLMIDARGQRELKFCKEMAETLLESLKKRFQHLENDERCQLAAAFHPCFRNLAWLAPAKHEDLKVKMQELIAAELKKGVEETPLTSTVVSHNGGAVASAEAEVTGADDDLWHSLLETRAPRARRDIYDVNARKIVETWTGTPVSQLKPDQVDLGDESSFLREKTILNLFLKTNTPVPSSAGVERLFSQGGDILRPKRTSLSDQKFNQLMFMRGNRKHWETYVAVAGRK